jgi:signal transduction histidine kinase
LASEENVAPISDAPRTIAQPQPNSDKPQMLASVSAHYVMALGLVLVGIFIIQTIINMTRQPTGHNILAMLIFLAGLSLVVLARSTQRLPLSLASLALALVLGLIVYQFIDSNWGDVILYAVGALAILRLPIRWAIAYVVAITLALIWTHGLHALLRTSALPNTGFLLGTLETWGAIIAIAGSLRARSLVIARLRATQEQLRAEMARTGELATARERARIARDIHDVLAHSLTTLSVQVQAARQIVRQQPERAATMLDDMALVLKESLAESRQVVGLLREAPPATDASANLRSQLSSLADRFSVRTGVSCALEEIGEPHATTEKQTEALAFALRETLTNAYRHGAAHHVRAELRWQRESVTLTVRDDGQCSLDIPPASAGNGLRGMRERATALGGSVVAGPRAEGGFAVTICLPLSMMSPPEKVGAA